MLAATAALFAACAETDLVNDLNVESNGQAIGFSTYAGKVTRAENNPTDYSWNLEDHHTSFTVYAGKLVNGATQAVYSDAKEGTVTCNNAVWTADPMKYWDKTATKYYFYAGAPANDAWVFEMENDYSDGYLKYDNFTLDGENLADGTATHFNHWAVNHEKNDIDLMIASPCPVDRAAYNNAAPEKVNLQFNHILSRLSIKVAKGTNISEDQPLLLKSLDVVGLKNQGDFNEVLEKADMTAKIARWSVDESTYTLPAVSLNNEITTAVYTHQYLVIPQSVNYAEIDTDGSDTKGQVYFHIQYSIDGEDYYAYYNLANAFKSETLNFNEGWENTLIITINPSHIRFDAEVSEWSDFTTPGQTIK